MERQGARMRPRVCCLAEFRPNKVCVDRCPLKCYIQKKKAYGRRGFRHGWLRQAATKLHAGLLARGCLEQMSASGRPTHVVALARPPTHA